MKISSTRSLKRRFAFSDRLPKLMPDLAEYMTAKEAADALGFTARGIHMLIKKSKLDAVSVGRMYLVSRKSVKDYLEKTQGMDKNDPRRKAQLKQ